MADRYFRNTLDASGIANAADKQILQKAVLGALERIRGAVQLPKNGLSRVGTAYVGSTGIAYLFWHLARHVTRGTLTIPRNLIHLQLDPEDAEDAKTSKDTTPATAQEMYKVALSLCEASVEAILRRSSSRSSFLEGLSGPLSLKCALLEACGQTEEAAHHSRDLVDYIIRASKQLDNGDCEVMYGRAGLLYSLLFVERTCPSVSVPSNVLQSLVWQIVTEGTATGQRLAAAGVNLPPPSFMFEWHGKPFLGAAHGLCGILHVLTLANHHVQQMKNHADVEYTIKMSACNLALQMCQPSGNIPPLPCVSRDELVQWCHGAPGLLMLLSELHSCYGSNFPYDFARLMPISSDNVWQRGLLKKGLGLCHGIAGNGYSFLSEYRALKEAPALHHAQQFGAYASQVQDEIMMVPERPMSLYEGLAGAACFWADLLDPEFSHFPGYDLPVVDHPRKGTN